MKKMIFIIFVFFTLFGLSLFLQTPLITIQSIESPNLFLQEIKIFNSIFLLTDILILIIAICVSVMFITLLFVLWNRNRMEKREKIRQEMLEVFQKVLFDAAVGEEIPIDNIKWFLKNDFIRQIMIDQAVDLARNFKGVGLKRIKNLYYELDLNKDTRNKLFSRKWNLKIKAFKELSSLGIDYYNWKIKKYINSSNSILRMEALIALVRLSPKRDAFWWLYNLKTPFSRWEQITLHQLMIDFNIEPPDFSKYLESKNETLVMFALRMMREYKQKDNISALRKALSYPNSKVRTTAIEVIGDLQITELAKDLKKIYRQENYYNEVKVLQALQKIHDDKTVGFLQNVIDIEDDVQLQIEAAKAILSTGEKGRISLEKMMKSDYKNYNIIIKHILDKRIF